MYFIFFKGEDEEPKVMPVQESKGEFRYTKLQMKLFGIISFSALIRNRRDFADLRFSKICDLLSANKVLNPEQGFFMVLLTLYLPDSA